MSEKDFTHAERREIREMLRNHRAEKLSLASRPPEGSEHCGQVGRYSIYKLVGQVLMLVAVLTLPESGPLAMSRGIAIVEMPIRVLNKIMPEPGPRGDLGEYPREDAMATNTAHPDHMRVIGINTVEATTTPEPS